MIKTPILSTIENTYKKSLSMHIALLIITVISLIIALLLDHMLLLFGLAQLSISVLFMIAYKVIISKKEEKPLVFDHYQPFIEPINTAIIIALLTPLRANILVLILALIITILFKSMFASVFKEQLVDPILLGLIFSQMAFGERLNISDTFISMFEGTIEDVSFIRLLIGFYEGFTISSAAFIFLAFAAIYLVLAKAIDRMILKATIVHLTLFTVALYLFKDYTFSFLFTNLWLGPTAFSLVFLIPEYTTSPETKEGKMIYSFLVIGLFIVFRLTFKVVASILYALVLAQLIIWVVERFKVRTTPKRRTQVVYGTVIIWLIIITGLIVT